MRTTTAVLVGAAITASLCAPASPASAGRDAGVKVYSGTLQETAEGSITVSAPLSDGAGRSIDLGDFTKVTDPDNARMGALLGEIAFTGGVNPCPEAAVAVFGHVNNWANLPSAHGRVSVTCPRGDGTSDRYWFGSASTGTPHCVTITRLTNGFSFTADGSCVVSHWLIARRANQNKELGTITGVGPFDLEMTLGGMPPYNG